MGSTIIYQPLKCQNYRLLLKIYYYLLNTLNVPKSLIYLLETPLMFPIFIISPTLYPLMIKRPFWFCVVSLVQSRLHSYLDAVPERVIGSSGSQLSAVESPKPILAKLLRRDRVGAAVRHGPGRKRVWSCWGLILKCDLPPSRSWQGIWRAVCRWEGGRRRQVVTQPVLSITILFLQHRNNRRAGIHK